MAKEKVYHLAELLPIQAERYGSNTALKRRLIGPDDKAYWEKISWRRLDKMVMRCARSLIEFGVQPQDKVGVFSENKVELIYADYAIYSVRGVCVPIYATSSGEQLSYIARESELKILFVGDQMQYNIAHKLKGEISTLKQIVVFSPGVRMHPEDNSSLYFSDFLKLGDTLNAEAEVKVRRSNALLSDVAILIYTSGTSGNSKGVILTHNNICVAHRAHFKRIRDMSNNHYSLNFLPMSHVFEKLWCYLCQQRGVKVAVCDQPKEVLTYLKEVKPHFMCNVPRFWEKVYIGVEARIEGTSPRLRKFLRSGIEVGRKYNLEYISNGKRPPFWLSVQYQFFDLIGFRKVKKAIGVSRGKMFPTAGAAVSVPIAEFLLSMGIPITIGYGLSETSATISFCPPKNYDIRSVGEVLPGLAVKIDPLNGEIMVKGGTVTPGYYKNEAASKAAFTKDGWFRTGDKGILEGKTLYFVERIKDLFKTANGKYIAPQLIEGLITADKYIEQLAVIADGRNFVSALVYPDWPSLIQTLRERGELSRRETPYDKLAEKDVVYNFLMGRIEQHQQSLASYERIKRIIILPEPFTMEAGELTNTLKLKRHVIHQRYAQQLDQLYEDAAREYVP